MPFFFCQLHFINTSSALSSRRFTAYYLYKCGKCGKCAHITPPIIILVSHHLQFIASVSYFFLLMGYSPSTIPHFRRSPEYLSPKNSAVLSSETSNANCRTIIIYSFLKNNRDFLTLSPQISKNFWNLSDFETFFNLYFAKSKKRRPFIQKKRLLVCIILLFVSGFLPSCVQTQTHIG